MATENIVSKVYRVLTDVSSRVWDKISFWCLAKDVELANGKNLETTCGSITGITSSLTSTSTTMAASASAIKELNDKIADLNSNLVGEINSVEQRTFVANTATTITLDGKPHLVIMSGTYSGYDRTPTNVTISSGTVVELKVNGNNGSYYIAFKTSTELSVDVTVVNNNNRYFISYITIL